MIFVCKEISCRLEDLLSGANQERLRLKRRRIESHFLKMENVESASFTIAAEEVGETVAGGYFLRLSAKSPIKPLQVAHEGYCLDTAHAHILSPVLHALVALYCLHLFHVPVALHFVSKKALERCVSLLSKEELPKDLIEEAICFLCNALPKVEVLSCMKGAFFEKMQSKMYLVKHHNVNDLATLDFEIVARSALGQEF